MICDYCKKDLAGKADTCSLIVHKNVDAVIFTWDYCDVACLAAGWQVIQ